MKACTGNRQLWAAACAGVPWIPPLQGGWSCGSPAGSSCQERSCPEGGHCCCCYLLDKKKRVESQITPHGIQLRSEDVVVCLWTSTPRTKLQIHRSFCFRRSIMKHLENFNYKNIFSGFCCDPDDNFFFSIMGSGFFFPSSQKLVLMYPRLKFLK